MDKKEILIQTAREYFSSGDRDFSEKKYNSAVVLYFKCLIALSDLFILINIGETPSSHNSRFRIAQEKFPEVYDILDKDFPFYQNSYIQLMSKELAEVLREDAKVLAEKVKVNL